MSGGLPVLPEGFGRAAEKLADTIRHVVDIAVGPDRIRARAQAQADSAVIHAEGRAQIYEVEARAIERLRKREARRQQNIESITIKALSALPPPEQISDQTVNEDWTSRFFEECQDISDEQMQQIWASIMAGEVAHPGSFGPRTLNVVRNLTKADANSFTKVCELAWSIPELGFVPVIRDYNSPQFADSTIYYAELRHLTAIGLIDFNSLTGFGIGHGLKEISVSYFDRVYKLKSDKGTKRRFEVGKTVFTSVGSELCKVVKAQRNNVFEEMTLNFWNSEGWNEASGTKES